MRCRRVLCATVEEGERNLNVKRKFELVLPNRYIK